MTKKTARPRATTDLLDLDRFVPFLLNSLTRRFNARLELAFRRKGLTIHDWRLLATLANTELNRPADIADYIATDPSTLSRMIDRFARAGIVIRKKPAGEARVTELQLTALGRLLYEAAFVAIAHERDRLLSSLSGQERNQFMRILVKLCDSYEPSAVLPVRDGKPSAA